MSYAKNTVLDILQDSRNFQNHARTYAATTVTKMAYGKDTPTSGTDTEVKDIRRFLEVFRMAVRPGAYLVDSIPWLKYIPWYGQELKREFKSSRRIYINQLNCVNEQLQSNADIGPSFARYMLENEGSCGLSEMEMASLAGDFFAAGTDTVDAEGHLTSTGRKIIAFPQELQYSETIGKPVPSRYEEPDSNRLRAISRDPEVYHEPDKFKPERWINDQGRPRDDLKYFVYGFGRRICPAQHVAARSVFINSVLILWAFQLTLDPTKPLDDMGFMTGMPLDEEPCVIEFKTRISETELRRIMQCYPEVA
ncbi:hypothetical protein AZE42_07459 [Rhizopogon vesiculosus]|uniref:Cytochrome P450 n=1 Tax=Rhizopogon vesiculosus TaxID=180088 RepID=A0A1J8QJL4_9AGAM|nr:hypothetical protein AZE42_07459 [Rhizopogon vesiculosus]